MTDFKDFDVEKIDIENFDVKSYIVKKQSEIEMALGTCLKPYEAGAEVLFEAMEYSLMAGGKRLRPLMFLAVLESFGKDSKDFLNFACGLEMIHTYSLIHDDLPAMDDDDLRRGKPSCHKQFDEATAILAGDGLLTHSFAKMLSVLPFASAENVVAATSEVSISVGLGGMVSGQVMDLAAEDRSVELLELQQIHRYKTGKLLACSVKSAGILAACSAEEVGALEVYGEKFGLAFQIVDDILDVVADEATLGKPVGSDAQNHKTTYITLLGLEDAKAAAKVAVEEAKAAIEVLGSKGEMLRCLADYFLNREF